MALVITIVILIILAGVSINVLTGQDGLIQRALQAKEQHLIAQYKEQIDIVKAETRLKSDNEITLDNINDSFNENSQEYWVSTSVIDSDIQKIVLTTKDGFIFYVTENTTEYKGKGEVVETPQLEDILIAQGYNGTYDGNAHGISVICEGATIKYGIEEGIYDLDVSPTYTRPGTYTIYYQVSMEGYETINDSKTVSITYSGLLADIVEIGEYVAYNPTVSNPAGTTAIQSSQLTYTSYANNDKANTSGSGYFIDDGNGHDVGQTYTATANTKWRVFSTNTTTGEVVLISESPILTDANKVFYLYGAKGYLYAEKELNEICKIYGYGYGAKANMQTTYSYGDRFANGDLTGTITSGARSMNVNDIETITIGDSYTHTITYPTIATETGQSVSKSSRTDTTNITTEKIYTDTDSEIYKLIYRDITDTSNATYLLASRSINSYSTGAEFCVRRVRAGGINNRFCFDSSVSIGIAFANCGIRPLVYLQSTLQTDGKNENGEWILK